MDISYNKLMKTDSLLAISPLDGRYNSVNNELSYITSEYGLIKYRLFIEVEWFKHLSNTNNIPEIPKLSINNICDLDDLIENFFIRLFRGSGLKGLASFGAESGLKEGNIKIIRPLINHEKSDLEHVSKKVFKFFINDPSNTDEKFTRSRIRNFLKAENFDLKKLKQVIKKY